MLSMHLVYKHMGILTTNIIGRENFKSSEGFERSGISVSVSMLRETGKVFTNLGWASQYPLMRFSRSGDSG
jgi:hypothetical protein